MEPVFSLALDAAPDLLALHQLNPQYYPALLESSGAGPALARYDILLVTNGERLTLHRHGELDASGAPAESADFLENLDRWWHALRRPVQTSSLPFHGGWFLYLSYEFAAEIEPALRAACADHDASASLPLPLATALRCPAALIHDRRSGVTTLVSESQQEALIATIHDDLTHLRRAAPETQSAVIASTKLREDDPARFLGGVARAQRHIREGDVFQVNLSRGWSIRLRDDIDDTAIYRRLRHCNPAPFSALARLNDATVISSSPERLIEVRGNIVQTRPIAGTHPRGADEVSDKALVTALLDHPKERAEHIMLIDLERNDLGRVCVPGTVQVDELMTIETYAHVHHIVSNVRGQLRADISPGAIIRAVFPGGTITGCPKVRCMQIIAALEDVPRGAYTGALGYLDRDGSMDLNILIRTLVRSGDRIALRAGAGIVADSIALRELDETRAKARGLLRVFHDN
jgi:anthranilate synthase component 1